MNRSYKPHMAFLSEKLKVYQKAVDFAESIISTTENFLKGYYFLRDQLNRASTSIAANTAACIAVALAKA